MPSDNIFHLDDAALDRISREINVRPIISDFWRSIRVTQELIEVTDRERQAAARHRVEEVGRQVDRSIMDALVGSGTGMTVASVESVSSSLTLDDLRRAMQAYCGMVPDVMLGRERTADEVRLRNEQAQRYYQHSMHEIARPYAYRPTWTRVKAWAVLSRHGLASVEGVKGRRRTFYSMGVVKTCDESITWDSEAMERGEKWETRKL